MFCFRLFWFLVFLLSVTCCSVLIIQMYGKWKNSPLNFNDKTTPVWEIPFPAVTICPETKVLNKYLNFTKCFKTIMKTQYNKSFNLTNTELLRLEALAHVCELQLLEHEKLNSEIELNEIIPTLQNIAPTMNSTLRHCFWERKLQHCDQIYTQIITEEGSCFTFNILNSTAIYREKS